MQAHHHTGSALGLATQHRHGVERIGRIEARHRLVCQQDVGLGGKGPRQQHTGALALRQGGYDWALFAYAVGFGGSMVWFGSSAGVALTNLFPEGRSVLTWLKQGWFLPIGYAVGFFALLAITGWAPDPPLQAAVAH